jgi:uncharacterized repeat protein (TIGR03803 family)
MIVKQLEQPLSRKFIFVVAATILTICLQANAQTETVLHNFSGSNNDGGNPQFGGLLFLDGKFYGTTNLGGNSNDGVVYELAPQSTGQWQFSLIYSFAGGSDGWAPLGSLIADQAGNLYGTTSSGGAIGSGTVYRLAKNSSGTWQKIILWSFGASGDGEFPFAGLVFDRTGNLYGTTTLGGAYGEGTVFEVSPKTGGGWSEKVLYSFGAFASDGNNPYDPLIIDASGNLYGTTAGGGSTSCDPTTLGCGTVFELSPGSKGWAETILHWFEANGTDGFYTLAPVVMDKNGNLYGTTSYGGNQGNCQIGVGTGGCGTAFQLTPSSDAWNEEILYNFTGNKNSDFDPDSGLIIDSARNLYGETGLSSQSDGAGSVYRLALSSSGTWQLKVLFNFEGTDGSNPQGGVTLLDSRLFGTTFDGGTSGDGVVFELAP